MADSHDHGNVRRTFWAALLTGGFMLAEIAGGIVSGSLALIADAAHMLTDSVSLTFAWVAFRLAERPPDDERTYGWHRFQIVVAFANGLSLFFIIGWIVWEAVQRLAEPVPILGGTMLLVAAGGLLVNILAFALLHGADRENLNIRGALLHVMGDLLGSVAALAAAVVILWSGWTPIDPLLSMLVAAILLRGAWRLVRESGHILMEGTPVGLDIATIRADLEQNVPGLEAVHHIHVWSLTQEKVLITLHAKVADPARAADVKGAIRRRLGELFSIAHATIEIE